MNLDLKELKGLPPITWGYAVVLILAIIAPGMLLLYFYEEELFYELESLKLILLSVSVTVPIFALNSILCSVENGVRKPTETGGEYYLKIFILGAFLTSFVLYIPILTKFLFDISNEMGKWIGVGVQIVIFLLMSLAISVKDEDIENSNKNQQG
jgi:hypothetical protein